MRRSFVSLFWCLVFLLFILYAFALVLLQGFSNFMADNMEDLDPIIARNIEKRFRSMPVVMLSLYKATTGGADWGEYLDIAEVAGPIYGGLFVFYTAFFTFAVTNILTGMIVENVVKMAHGDDEAVLFTFRQQQHHAVVDVQRIFQQLDADGDGELNAEEFQRGMASDEVRALMSSVQLDVKDVVWFFQMLLETTGGKTLQIDAFVEACMKMKGNATSVDMQCIDFEVKLCRQGVSDLFLEVDAIAASVESSADRVLLEVGNRIEQALAQTTQLETSRSQARV